jgi:hypothetical protein
VKFLQTYLVVDSLYRILWVGGDWDDFADQNGGGEVATATRVLSTSLLSHVADARTREHVLTIVDTVLGEQAAFHLRYRCDSPAMKRDLLMSVTPMREQRVLMTHDLIDLQPMPRPAAPWDHAPGAKAQKCSFCCAVCRPGGRWSDPFRARLPHPRAVDYTVCPRCEERIETALADTRARKGEGPPAE